jgi:hypothetical protein
MMPGEVVKLARFYGRTLTSNGAQSVRESLPRDPEDQDSIMLDHASWMAGKLEVMAERLAGLIADLAQGPLDTPAALAKGGEARLLEHKIQRWLGFVQGVLWSSGLFTIDELRDHTKSDDDAALLAHFITDCQVDEDAEKKSGN